MRHRAFTLVELLVVLGIIAVLAAILLPVLGKVRVKANHTRCQAHLRDIGSQFQMYLNESNGRLPRVNTMPSIRPPVNDAPSIVQILEPFARGAKGVYECPADRITAVAVGAPAGFDTYFAREGCSYQYNPFLASMFAGKTFADTQLADAGRRNLLPLFFDYEPFHADAGQAGSTNYLFHDMHVGDIGQ